MLKKQDYNNHFKFILEVTLFMFPLLFVAQNVNFVPSALNSSSTQLNKITSIADMNNDNLDDIVLIADDSSIQIHYQQDDGSFVEANYTIPVINLWLFSVTIGDLDNNGYKDIVLGHQNDRVDVCFANTDGTAYNVTSYTDYSVFSQRGTLFDIDLDGDLDIFMCHDVGENLVLKNQGSQTFISDPALLSITNPLQGIEWEGNYGAIWVDYDNDNDADLYISKCKEGVTSPTDKRRVNQLYRNNGDGTFTDVADLAGLDDGDQSWAAAFEDFDLDGDFDAFILNHTGTHKLMLNNGDGTFTDIISTTGINMPGVNGNEVDSFDFNNDGYMDIYSQLNKELYINNGDLTFTGFDLDFNQNRDEIETETGNSFVFETGAVGDLNNDGFLDVYDSQGFIQINQPNSNNWLKLNLNGITSNKQGVGAKVVVVSNLGTQTKEMRIGTSYSIQNTNTMHFGLGQDTSITSLTVQWPSGVIDQIINPDVNSLLVVNEGDNTMSVDSLELDGVKLFPNPVRDYLNIQYNNINTVNSISIRDINGKLVYKNVLDSKSQNIQSINLKQLIEGIYFVEISFKNQSNKITKKIIKRN